MTEMHIIKSPLVKLLEDDIDTDQMVPARFLKTQSAKGLSKILFYDRIHHNANTLDSQVGSLFPLSPSNYIGQKILLTGRNFGCGSSREHAPWALLEFGIQAVLAPSFGDIFRSNALKNGLLAIEIGTLCHEHLRDFQSSVEIDLINLNINAGPKKFDFKLDAFARFCLLNGMCHFDYLWKSCAQVDSFFHKNKSRFSPINLDEPL